MGIFLLGSPKRTTLEAHNATTIEGPLYSDGSIGFAKTATWYLINDKVLDDKQVQLFSSLLKESQVSSLTLEIFAYLCFLSIPNLCEPTHCLWQVALNITGSTTWFHHESDFNEFNANAPNNSKHFAIIWNVFNDSLAKYTIRFPYDYVPNGHAKEGIGKLRALIATCPKPN